MHAATLVWTLACLEEVSAHFSADLGEVVRSGSRVHGGVGGFSGDVRDGVIVPASQCRAWLEGVREKREGE